MSILIIESDMAAARHLKKLLKELAPARRIAGHCRTASQAEEWFSTHPAPDIIFAAVQLSDGLSFDVLKNRNNKSPVIFTCHLEKYAMQSFKVNGFDYLLKPVQKEQLQEALKRCDNHIAAMRSKSAFQPATVPVAYQQRFIVSVGKQMKVVQAAEIAYFYAENKIVYLVMATGEKYMTDYTLEQLSKVLNPKIFFRINRQFIINISSIVKMIPASKSRLELTLKPEPRFETITSNERTADFRKWLTGIL